MLSIITVTFNAEDYLQKTIDSLSKYNYIEHIVIDGFSNDNTVDIIKKNKKTINYWVSEKDRGLFDAMNKGINKVTNDWVIFINAGDQLVINESVLFDYLDKNKDVAVIYGDTLNYENKLLKSKPLKSLLYGGIPACHQSILFNYRVLKKNLFYDLGYKMRNDHELVARLYKMGFQFNYFTEIVSKIEKAGFSTKNIWQSRISKLKMTYRIFGIRGLLITLLTMFKIIPRYVQK